MDGLGRAVGAPSHVELDGRTYTLRLDNAVIGEVENYMRCPRCEGRLHKFNYTYGSAVHIDRCGSCFGVWLDDGELDTIIVHKKEMEEEFDRSKMNVFMRSVGKSLDKK